MAGTDTPRSGSFAGAEHWLERSPMPYPRHVPIFRYSGSMARNVHVELHMQRMRLDTKSIYRL